MDAEDLFINHFVVNGKLDIEKCSSRSGKSSNNPFGVAELKLLAKKLGLSGTGNKSDLCQAIYEKLAPRLKTKPIKSKIAPSTPSVILPKPAETPVKSLETIPTPSVSSTGTPSENPPVVIPKPGEVKKGIKMRKEKKVEPLPQIPAEPTPPSTQPIQPPTQPIQPPAQPIQPAQLTEGIKMKKKKKVEPLPEIPAEPILPPAQLTQPPSQPPAQPTQPPAQPPAQPTQPPAKPPAQPTGERKIKIKPKAETPKEIVMLPSESSESLDIQSDKREKGKEKEEICIKEPIDLIRLYARADYDRNILYLSRGKDRVKNEVNYNNSLKLLEMETPKPINIHDKIAPIDAELVQLYDEIIETNDIEARMNLINTYKLTKDELMELPYS